MRAEAIQRYAEPIAEPDEPATGACWNCGHMADVKIGGKTYCLCVLNRDVGAEGDVYVCAPERDCSDWAYHE